MRSSRFLFPRREGGVYTLQNARGGSGGNFSENSFTKYGGRRGIFRKREKGYLGIRLIQPRGVTKKFFRNRFENTP